MKFLHTNQRISSYPAYERLNYNYRATHPIVDGLLGWYRTDYMNTDQVTNGANGETYEGVTRIHNRWGSLSDFVPFTDANGNKLYPSIKEFPSSSRSFVNTDPPGNKKYVLENDETIETPLTLTVAWYDPDHAYLIYSNDSSGTTIECDNTETFAINGNDINSTISLQDSVGMISSVWNNDGVSLWVNGTDMGTVNASTKYKGEVFSGNTGNSGFRYGCIIGEWLFHDRALSSSEIQQEHNRMRSYFTGDRDKYHRYNYS